MMAVYTALAVNSHTILLDVRGSSPDEIYEVFLSTIQQSENR